MDAPARLDPERIIELEAVVHKAVMAYAAAMSDEDRAQKHYSACSHTTYSVRERMVAAQRALDDYIKSFLS